VAKAKPDDVMIGECANSIGTFAHALDPAAFTKKELDTAVNNALGQIGRPKNAWDVAIEIQINSLLSGFGTPIANAASVIYKQITNPMIDAVESLNPKSQKEFGDVVAGIQAMLQGFGSDAMYFKAGWTNAYPLDIDLNIRDSAKRLNISEADAREKFRQAIIEERVGLALQREPNLNRQSVYDTLNKNYKPTDDEINAFVKESYDYVRGAIPARFGGNIIRMPTRLSVAIDEYGKARFRRYKIAMLASQKARSESKGNAKKYKELYDQYMTDSMEHIKIDDDFAGKPDADMLRAEAVKRSFGKLQQDLDKVFGADVTAYKTVKEYALREMFQQRLTGSVQAVQDARNKYPLLHLFVPFMKTPWNIVKEGTTFIPGLPQVAKKYLGPKVDEKGIPNDMKNMGAYYEFTNEELLARNILGGTLFAMGMGMVQEGMLTGKPRNAAEAQAWKDAGIPQSSIRIGDVWVAYDRIEPLATPLGLIAEMGRLWDDVASLPEADQKWDVWGEEVGKGMGFAIKSQILQKTFFEGINTLVGDTVTAIERGDPSSVAVAIGRQFTPAILNQVARSIDPYDRQATTVVEKIQQRIPGLREELPIEYGLTGGPRERNMAQALTSFNVQSADQTPLQKAVYDLGVTKMREDDDLKSVELNNDQLSMLRKMSNDYISPRLERYVSSPFFSRQSKARQKVLLEKQIDRLKRGPRQRFYNMLRRSDPEMAQKFKVEMLRKRGRLE
jgi:hypothetical protein